MARKLEFKTEKERRTLRVRRLVVGFVVFVVLFAAVSALVLLRYYDFDLSNVFEGRVEETSEGDTTAADLSPLTGGADILLCCRASSSGELRFAAVARADLDARRILILPLSPTARTVCAGSEATLGGHLSLGGIPRLIEAVEGLTGADISRYISGDDSGFRDAVNEIGGLTVDLGERIEYRSDELFLVLPSGRQTLRGDMVLKYLRYCLTLGDAGLEKQAGILCGIVDSALSPSNLDDGDDLYRTLVNLLSTDVSIIDFTTAKPLLALLLSSGEMLPSKTVVSLADN